jgi:PAS domain-containing protein
MSQNRKSCTTFKKERNNALEKEETLFRALMDNMPDTIYIKDTECRFLDGNTDTSNITKAGTHENPFRKTDLIFILKILLRSFTKMINKYWKPENR